MSEIEWAGTYAEAKLEFERLGHECAKIQAQLTTRRPVEWIPQDEFDQFRDWRRRAIGAKDIMRQEREALRHWMQAHRPEPLKTDPTVKNQIAARLDELDIDYTPGELENLRRRLKAELVINERAVLILDLVEMFRDHDPCGDDCGACALLDRAEQEVA